MRDIDGEENGLSLDTFLHEIGMGTRVNANAPSGDGSSDADRR